MQKSNKKNIDFVPHYYKKQGNWTRAKLSGSLTNGKEQNASCILGDMFPSPPRCS